MLPLPPVLPDVAFRKTVRLPRDHYVRVDTCDYSVHPGAVGRLVEVRATTAEVSVWAGAQCMARHPRSWAPHRTVTSPEHEAARKVIVAFRRRWPSSRPRRTTRWPSGLSEEFLLMGATALVHALRLISRNSKSD